MKKKVLSMLVTIAMLFSLLPATALAAEDGYVAQVGETTYKTFSEAMTAANAMTGNVVVDIYGAVEFVNGMELNGRYDSITFNKGADGASITINQTAGGDYLEAHGKTVAFNNLTLAKANPAWAGNSGHMGNYFSIQGGTVTYTNCTFPNGACTSTGTATYDNCTFQNTSEYGLWVYDDALVTVKGGTINSAKGIKVYSEDETSVTSTLTVQNTTFTNNVIAKPAVAVGYARSITLIGNTYNNSTGVLELDSGSDADCEGITFVAKDSEGNDIGSTLTAVDRSNGGAACGVLMDGKIYTTVTEAVKDAKSGDTVTLLADVNTTESIKISCKLTIDLNGHTLAGTDSATGSFGLIDMKPGSDLTINDSSEDCSGAITLKADKDRDWNAYSSVISNQRGKLTVNGGTIQHLGGTAMAYGIDNLTNGTGTYAETIVNGGTVKSTYRAIRQFLNGTEAQNILTVNGGIIEGKNKSIWMQDPSTNANSGTLTVSDKATLVGDVYLFVTEGSTEWPVTVSIANAAFTGSYTVDTGNVPGGIEVKAVGGYWGISRANTPYVAAVKGVSYTTLQDAINAAKPGDTIIVLGDVRLSNGLSVAADDEIILDLNGKTVSYNTTENTADDMIVNKGDLTITDSSDEQSGKLSYKYSGTPDTKYSYDNATIQNEGKLTIKAGTVENTTAAMSHASYAINTNAGATLNVEGGKVLNLNGHAIRQVSFGTAANVVNISGGYIEGTRAVQFQLPGSASAATAPEMTLNITGGELKSNEDTYNLAVYVYSNGQSAENASVSVSGDAVINGNIALNGAATASMTKGSASVTGGTLNGKYGIFTYADDDTNNAITITGGTFATNYAEMYAEKGYVFESYVDGEGNTVYGVEPTYTVTITVTPAEATVVVKDSEGNAVVAEEDGNYVLTNGTYTYSVTKTGYNAESGEFTVNNAVVGLTVELAPRSSGGGGGGSSSSGDYQVTVDSVKNGKVTVSPSRADKGDTVTITVKPNDGYQLDKLTVTDKNGNTVKLTSKGSNKYTFTMPASKVTVEASFAKTSSSPVDSFLDVNTGAWYYDAVKYAVENGLMSGTGTYTFEPNTTLSRGMIAQMLYALEGKPSVSSANNFTDVSSSDWYDKAASWAQSKGIITGYEDGRFGPNDPLTREQLALILYNYAKSEGHSTSTKADLSKFADGTSTSPWAQQAMSWAVGEGLLSGRGVNMLYPTGTATRAEVAQIMMNFCENVAK